MSGKLIYTSSGYSTHDGEPNQLPCELAEKKKEKERRKRNAQKKFKLYRG